MDGSGPVNKRTKERWEEMKEFTLKFMKGFDEKARFGIIKYGGDPEFIMSVFTTKRTHEVSTMLKGYLCMIFAILFFASKRKHF